jgi:hypothetical protein
MADWKFLKKPEFWITQLIVIATAFGGGFFSGKSYVIKGDFANLQNKYNNIQNSQNHIQSINQQGGITANAVNIESPKRVVDKELLKQYLPSSKEQPIRITSVMGDEEAYNFATELKHYLQSEGWTIQGVTQSSFNIPIIGVIVYKEPWEFVVGAKP